MITRTISFRELPFSKLFSDYCHDFRKVSDFFEFNPFDHDGVNDKLRDYSFLRRSELSKLLWDYNRRDSMHEKAIENLNALCNDPNAVTVVTGQQLTVSGGPMFTLYKILTAIAYADKLQKSTKRTVVPIFWLADEDHDFAEIAQIGFPVGNYWSSHNIASAGDHGKRVAEIVIDDDIETFMKGLEEKLIPTDFNPGLMSLMKDVYTRGATHGEAFGALITHLFSKYGLILAGSARNTTKDIVKKDIIRLIENADRVYDALERGSTKIEKQYHRQAAVGESNWFYVDTAGVRHKLSLENGVWSTPNHRFTTDELVRVVEKDPGSVSPNVFMRPILQDLLLPNIAYVAGPGEVAYYGQMKELYRLLNMKMPVIVPRFSATILEGSVKKNFDELPFRLVDYSERIEDLETRYIKEQEQFDIQGFIDGYINQIEQLAEERAEVVELFDSTLLGTLQKVKSDQLNALEILRSKMTKSARVRLEVQLKRIQKVQLATFPNRNLQERELALIYVLNKYGFDIVDSLFGVVAEAGLNEHHLIDI